MIELLQGGLVSVLGNNFYHEKNGVNNEVFIRPEAARVLELRKMMNGCVCTNKAAAFRLLTD